MSWNDPIQFFIIFTMWLTLVIMVAPWKFCPDLPEAGSFDKQAQYGLLPLVCGGVLSLTSGARWNYGGYITVQLRSPVSIVLRWVGPLYPDPGGGACHCSSAVGGKGWMVWHRRHYGGSMTVTLRSAVNNVLAWVGPLDPDSLARERGSGVYLCHYEGVRRLEILWRLHYSSTGICC